MKFKPGDLVIKNTGGNKMTILSLDDNRIQCGWFTESYHESIFDEKELLPYSQYEKIRLTAKRDDLINQLLSK